MKRLYLRIYLAVLASLAVLTLLAGLLVHQFSQGGPPAVLSQTMATVASNVLPPVTAPPAEQQAALLRLFHGINMDVSLFASDMSPLATVGKPIAVPQRPNVGPVREWGAGTAWMLSLADGRWLLARPPAGYPRTGGRVLALLAFLALAIAVGAYPIVRRLTRRLERLQAGVEALGAGTLSARVPVEGNDEVARLAESFNQAATRIEALVAAHKSLLANASHELRTPLTRIRMGLALMQQDNGSAHRRELERDIAELDALIDEILLASRLDATQAAAQRESFEDVDLLALAAEECARIEGATLTGERVTIKGDPRLLRRLIRNLLVNAQHHGTPPIEVTVARLPAEARLFVSDQGPGIPVSERDRVFEPFYRRMGAVDGGAGLGLALVRQIARRHGGEAMAVDAGFRVTLAL